LSRDGLLPLNSGQNPDERELIPTGHCDPSVDNPLACLSVPAKVRQL
jgi:hypothetical protein